MFTFSLILQDFLIRSYGFFNRIVKAIMDLTRIGPFMERPDDSFFGLHDYYTVITKPIWIRESDYLFL